MKNRLNVATLFLWIVSLHYRPGSTGTSGSGSGGSGGKRASPTPGSGAPPSAGDTPAASPATGSAVRLSEEAAKKLRPLRKKDRILCDGVSERLGFNIKGDKPALLDRQADTRPKPPAIYRFPPGRKYRGQ